MTLYFCNWKQGIIKALYAPNQSKMTGIKESAEHFLHKVKQTFWVWAKTSMCSITCLPQKFWKYWMLMNKQLMLVTGMLPELTFLNKFSYFSANLGPRFAFCNLAFSFAIRQSPYTEGHLTQHGNLRDSRVSIHIKKSYIPTNYFLLTQNYKFYSKTD